MGNRIGTGMRETVQVPPFSIDVLTREDDPGAMPDFQVGATVNLKFSSILPDTMEDLGCSLQTILVTSIEDCSRVQGRKVSCLQETPEAERVEDWGKRWPRLKAATSGEELVDRTASSCEYNFIITE